MKIIPIDTNQEYVKQSTQQTMSPFLLDLIRSFSDLEMNIKGCFKMPKRKYKPIIKEYYQHIDLRKSRNIISTKRFKSVPHNKCSDLHKTFKINNLFKKDNKRVVWKEKDLSSKICVENKFIDPNLLKYLDKKDNSKESTALQIEDFSNSSQPKNKNKQNSFEEFKKSSSHKINFEMRSQQNISQKNKNKLKGIVSDNKPYQQKKSINFLDIQNDEDDDRLFKNGICTQGNSPINKKNKLLFNNKGKKFMNNKKFLRKFQEIFNNKKNKINFTKNSNNFCSKN